MDPQDFSVTFRIRHPSIDPAELSRQLGIEPQIVQGGRKGVEKESLRVTPDGHIATTPHPRALGSALTNEHITTDYSEALIELVTPPFPHTWELLQYLCDLHQFVYRHIGEELLWATSMPGTRTSIPKTRWPTPDLELESVAALVAAAHTSPAQESFRQRSSRWLDSGRDNLLR
jgi:hypothetical protein